MTDSDMHLGCELNLTHWDRVCNICMRPWTKPSLVQIITCHLFGNKPLSEPILALLYLLISLLLTFVALLLQVKWSQLSLSFYILRVYFSFRTCPHMINQSVRYIHVKSRGRIFSGSQWERPVHGQARPILRATALRIGRPCRWTGLSRHEPDVLSMRPDVPSVCDADIQQPDVLVNNWHQHSQWPREAHWMKFRWHNQNISHAC